MNNNIASTEHTVLVSKDKEIAKLNDLIKKNAEDHQQQLQRKISYYENILALMPGTVYWVDRDNVYRGCNDNQAKGLMLASRHDIVGKKTGDLITSADQAIAVERLNDEVMKSGIPRTAIENGTLPDGERVYFSQKVPLRDEQDEVIGLLGISLDITELKQTEAALTVAKEKAESANRAKVEFIANMSHDIRTPLSGVVGMSQQLVERLTNSEHKQFAQWINQSGEQLLTLLNSILDLVSAESVGEDDAKPEAFDLRQCIYDLVQLERPTTILKKIALNVEIDDRAPQYIVTDRTKLHRVLLNLLGNAIKFTESGFIQIDVNFIDFIGDKTYLQFQVIDTGIGIPLEFQDKVFDRFFRVNSSYDGIYSGYGVGLHIAQSYVKLLGGELKFTSQPGMGTTFYFDLPVVEAKAENAALNPADSLKDKDDMPNFNTVPPHILLVEDNAIALRMVELIAKEAGCSFQSTVNGEEALALVKSHDFDLVITDIGLPGMSGYELAISIREWEEGLKQHAMPVIGLTAHAKAKNQCIQSGMNDVFCKPFNLQIMKTILSDYLSYVPDQTGLTGEHQPGLPETDAQLFDLEQFPLVDMEHAVLRIGNKTVLNDMLHLMATQEIPNEEQSLQNAYAVRDWNTIERLAHKMKGGAVYCGTFRMQYACQYLERYHKSGRTALLEQLYQQLLRVLQETRQAIL